MAFLKAAKEIEIGQIVLCNRVWIGNRIDSLIIVERIKRPLRLLYGIL